MPLLRVAGVACSFALLSMHRSRGWQLLSCTGSCNVLEAQMGRIGHGMCCHMPVL